MKLSSLKYPFERQAWIEEYIKYRRAGFDKSESSYFASLHVLKLRDVRHTTKIETAINMLRAEKLSLEEIALYSGFDLKTVSKIQKRTAEYNTR